MLKNFSIVVCVCFWIFSGIVNAENKKHPDKKDNIHPFYIETIASFNSAVSGIPAYIRQHPQEVRILNIRGKVGATKLKVDKKNVDLKAWSGHWNGTIKYDDGTYGIYSIKSVDPVTREIIIYPALKKSAIAGQLTNTYDAYKGQHYTATGYYALAQHIYNYGRETAYREKYISRDDVTSKKSSWQKSGGWFAPGYRLNTFSHHHPAGTFFHSNAISTRTFNGNPGQFVTLREDLKGQTGYIETYIGLSQGLGPVKVEIVIDGNTQYCNDKIIGLERITVPFTNAKQGSIKITSAGTAQSQIRIGSTTWWTYDNASRYRGKLFPPNSKVVLYGDSWGCFFDSALYRELKSLLKNDNSTIINSSVGGKTAGWAIKNFKEKVLAHKPDILIIEFFTNDCSKVKFATWKKNISKLCSMAIKNGITPVVVLPAPTASVNQAQRHITWNGDFFRVENLP